MSKDEAGENLEFDWPCGVGNEEMTELMAWAESRGIPAYRLPMSGSEAGHESFVAPHVFSYVDGGGQLVFIHDLGLEGLLDLPDGSEAGAIPGATTLSLSRARQIYGLDLAGFGRTYHLAGAGAAGGTTAKRIDYSVELFVKKAGKAS
jgi:hypothetical protein